MTASEQLTLDELCDQGARDLYEPDPRPATRDLKGQGLTERERETITTIHLTGRWL